MISVIIPTYNRAEFLKESIRSVLDQNLFTDTPGRKGDLELIVIDDGSTDETKAVVMSFKDRCPLVYKYQPQRGVSTARNLGLDLARGEYIAFLDSDDLWTPDKIDLQMNFFGVMPSAKICYTEELWIRRGVPVNPMDKHRKHSGWIFDKVLPLCLISLSSALFRRELFDDVGTFDEDLPACEDYDFGIRVAHRFPVYLLTKPLIIKRGGHPDQLSRKYWGMDRFRIVALEKALDLGLSPGQRSAVRREIIRKAGILVGGFQKRGKAEEAKKYYQIIKKHE